MAKRNSDKNGFVFSTDPNFKFNHQQPLDLETLPPQQQNLKISLDKKQRRGKEVTIIEHFIGAQNDLDQLCKLLKEKCGTGGTSKDGQIIIQGDQKQKITELLQKIGYKIK